MIKIISPPGGSTPPSTTTFAPTLVSTGATFTVPANQQVLIADEVVLDGELVCDGTLAEVY